MSKLLQTVGMLVLVVGVTVLPMFTPPSHASADPCDGPRNEFLEGWCS